MKLEKKIVQDLKLKSNMKYITCLGFVTPKEIVMKNLFFNGFFCVIASISSAGGFFFSRFAIFFDV